jgi:protein-disulfide isomerase
VQIRYPLMAAVTAFAVILACSKNSSASSAATADSPDSALAKRADQGRIQGSSTAAVWLVEVSDFQCPYCKQWHDQSYAELKRAYVDSGKVRLAYVNFPLSMHRNAMPAAETAMCAAAQDKFWPLHDALFATQAQWETLPSPQQLFDSLATAAGVDMSAFHKCVSGHLMKATIEADVDRASKAGVESTPTFLIGGTMVTGAQPLAVFRKAIDAALAHVAGTDKR